MEQTTAKKLFRSRSDRIIAGVCGGLAKYFEIDPIIMRIIFLAAVFLHGLGLLVYLILALIAPLEPGLEMPVNKEEKAREFFTGTKDRAEALVDEMKADKSRFVNRRNMFGLLFVLAGVLLLLNQIFPYHWFRWDYFWPLVIIFIGILILFKK